VALQQHTTQFTEKYDHLSAAYAQLKADNAQQKAEHDQLREFVMNMASQSGDTCAPPPFWLYNNQPLPPPPAPPLC
jgi:cell division protein FtsB